MTERISLRLFLICLLSCATLTIIGIWFGSQFDNSWYFQADATLFVVGFASFLIWFSIILSAIRKNSKNL